MSTLYVMEAANLFCGDDDPTRSKHLSLSELKLPTLEEQFQEHHAGGSIVGIKVGVGIAALEATFKLRGWDPDLLIQFGLGTRQRHRYTAYGVIRDKRTNRAIEAKAVMEARLAKIEIEAFQRGEFTGHDYMLDEIMHYELHFDEAEKFYFDFFTQEYRVNGTSENGDERRILRIPGT